MARKADGREARRVHIIEAALRVFAAKGFSSATNQDVAKEAGITPGLIYHYFDNKEDLFRAVLEKYTPFHLLENLNPDMLTLPPEVFLQEMLMRILGVLEQTEYISLVRVILPEVLKVQEGGLIVQSLILRMLNFLRGYLQHQAELGRIAPTTNLDFAMHAILGSMITMVMRRQILRDHSVLALSQSEIASGIVNTVFNGIGTAQRPALT
jgi:AcrR family transcriptional regulator